MTPPQLLIKPPSSATTSRIPWRTVTIALAIVAAMILSEHFMGRLFLSKSGRLLFWVSQTDGPETSQQLFDWYSITHIEHGLLFYGMIWLFARALPNPQRLRAPAISFLAALLIESAWEVLENSTFIINRFRAQTAAVGYTGDTILNSFTDVLSCMLGWWLARKLPPWAAIALFILIELTVGLLVRDSFLLSTLMLAWPIDAIKRWQTGT